MTLQGPIQLDIFGAPPTQEPHTEAIRPVEAPRPVAVSAPSVSAERATRALQRSLPVVRDADPDPAGFEGWRHELKRPRPRAVGGQCTEVANRVLGGWSCSVRCGWTLDVGPAPRRCPSCVEVLGGDPDAMALRSAGRPVLDLAPCAWTACPHHLAVDVGETVTIGPVREAELVLSTAGRPPEMGRRGSLSSTPETAGEVHDFAVAVVERVPEMPDTCTLDVIDRYPDEAPIAEVARVLGVSEEMVRVDTNRAIAKILAAGGALDPKIAAALLAGRLLGVDGAGAELTIRSGADPHEVIERAASKGCGQAPVSARAPVADPVPAPARIVRVEREAPAPRELTADDVFTF